MVSVVILSPVMLSAIMLSVISFIIIILTVLTTNKKVFVIGFKIISGCAVRT
jgi:hypothetical protein